MNINAICEINYAGDAEAAAICKLFTWLGNSFALKQDNIVFLNVYYVCMESTDSHVGMMLAVICNNCDI